MSTTIGSVKGIRKGCHSNGFIIGVSASSILKKNGSRVIARCLLVAACLVAVSIISFPLDWIENGPDHMNLAFAETIKSSMHHHTTLSSKGSMKDNKYHIVFSTGCSIDQDWQSYAFFYHALVSGQEGQVTRIVSGCSETQRSELDKHFAKEINSMAPDRFHLHHTPNYAHLNSPIMYKYFNKPYGMKHWFDNALNYPQNHKTHDDSIVILMDPDQIIKRPFTNEFSNSEEEWWLPPTKKQLSVQHGSPFAQLYGFGVAWRFQKNIVLDYVFQNSSVITPVKNMTKQEANDYYHGMGPPYIATAKDMYAIVNTWCEIVPRVHDKYPKLLAEMFGYNLAAAHLGLRHSLAKTFMLSSPMTYRIEAWKKLVDPLSDQELCSTDLAPSHYPHVLHYCQNYAIGKYYFSKYIRRRNVLSCDSPLLMEPPSNSAEELLLYSSTSNNNKNASNNHQQQDIQKLKHDAFMACNVIRALNEAVLYYKKQNCESANYNYSQLLRRK